MKHIVLAQLIVIGFRFGFVEAKTKLYIPNNPKANAALFVMLHGCLSDAEEIEKTTRMSDFAEKFGFYVFYPEPYLGAKDSKGCFEFYTEASQQFGGGDAVQVINAVQRIVSQYDIDSKKIFVAGMSGGASLASVLISCYPDQIQGAAIHSGMGYGLAQSWKEALLVAQVGPIPFRERSGNCSVSDYHGKIMLIQGSRDIVMNSSHYRALTNDFLSGAVRTTKRVIGNSTHFSYLQQKFYERGELIGQGIYVIGMNHEWSGYKSINPIGPLGPDVSRMMVEFFLGESLP